MLLTTDKLRHLGFDIVGDCIFYNKDEEAINHNFIIVTWPITFDRMLTIFCPKVIVQTL